VHNGGEAEDKENI